MSDLEPTRQVALLRRRPRRSEVTSGLLALAVGAVLVALLHLDPGRPVQVVATLGLIALAAALLARSQRRGWRSDADSFPRVSTLEPVAARRLLRRELRRGRPGPVELRPLTRAWAAGRFRSAGSPSVLLFLAGWDLVLIAPADDRPALWVMLGAAAVALLVLAGLQLSCSTAPARSLTPSRRRTAPDRTIS